MKRRLKILILAAGVIITPVLLSPFPRFGKPCSTVVEARDGTLLGARIADDGQWRFPPADTIPEKFKKALLTFEDRYFYYHPGINPVSIIRALISNIRAGEIVSGGSTITMQVARISRGNRQRNYPEKIVEMLSAIKLELFRSKGEIFRMYASNAPFGGNIVGLEAAAWRYTGKPASHLTWAEAATFAVLPNSPGLIYPGKNQERLRSRRDELLNKLYHCNFFDSLTLVLSLDEPLPGEPFPLPSIAPQLTDHFFITKKGTRNRTTIDADLQEKALEIIGRHRKILSENHINNAACLIVSVPKGEVIAYVGNSDPENPSDHGADVDMIKAQRSTGSILKPILYAGLLNSGEMLPESLVPDVPTRFPGFSPKNFDFSYSGAIPASRALSQSLNIPAVKMLQRFGTSRFLDLLRQTGITTLNKSPDYYGLSLILGGGEASLWELTGAYASLSRILNRYAEEKRYLSGDYHPPLLSLPGASGDTVNELKDPPLRASSVWLTYKALLAVNRPDGEAGWHYFSSSRILAWKTGTSYGFRDGWAIGTTPEYVVGVWAGNADGEGRPGLTGISAAAPILFELFTILPQTGWFKEPVEELTSIKVCRESGYRAGPDCIETKEIFSSVSGLKSNPCPYHRIIHLDPSGTRQVDADCIPAVQIKNESWFVLPPAMEYFYRQRNPGYNVLPPVAPGCNSAKSIPVMEFIYPTQGVKIFIPRDQSGELTRVIPEIAHRNPGKKVYWHLDEKFSGTTQRIHQIEIFAEAGDHILTVVDEDGNTIKCNFKIAGRSD